jgi:hypothetical protein
MGGRELDEWAILLRVIEVVEQSILGRRATDSDSDSVSVNTTVEPGSILLQRIDINQEENEMGDQYITGQAAAVGPASFGQMWNQVSAGIDLGALAGDLRQLRGEMRRRASDAEHDLSVAAIVHAEAAASSGDGAAVLSHLSRAGTWALGIATAVGAGLAVEALRAALGL